MIRIFILALISALCPSYSEAKNPPGVMPTTSGELVITFDARIGNKDFALNQDFNIGSQTLNFNKLRYWVSNLVLITVQGTEYIVPDSYFLMEEVDDLNLSGTIKDKMTYPANKRETITLKNVPAGKYKSVKFSIGVDSKFNDNLSLRAGELTIANGMSSIVWMWHSSYIFSSIAGSVKQGAETKDFKVETGLNANYQTRTVDFPAPINSTASKGIVLNVDVAKVFDGIDLIKTPLINAMTAPLMTSVANNQATKAIVFGSETK
ncbi:MbnP family protein [Dyadobacter luteus]|nr:MbnP family protein [Dyadobacter luteus]